MPVNRRRAFECAVKIATQSLPLRSPVSSFFHLRQHLPRVSIPFPQQIVGVLHRCLAQDRVRIQPGRAEENRAGIPARCNRIFLFCMVDLGRNFVFALLKTHPDPYSFKIAFQSYSSAAFGCMLILAVFIYCAAMGFRWNERSRIDWFYVALCSLTALSSGKLSSKA